MFSLKAQEEYYKTEISKNLLWEFVGIYSDKASGRSRKAREQFELMMSDCHERKIDIILVKSISRFGRNTLDTINALNELKTLGVNVIFEIEKLNSFTSGKLRIELNEAEIIKKIFQFYLEGKSRRQLAYWLEENGVKSPRGSYKWSAETINKMLSNEKIY